MAAKFDLTDDAVVVIIGSGAGGGTSCFAPNSPMRKFTPVMLPLGRARLATRPSPTGSSPTAMTTGIVVVDALAASADGSPVATSKATCRRTNSAAKAGNRSI